MQKSLNDVPDRIPKPALVLGIGGLIPFVVIPLIAALGGDGELPADIRAYVSIFSMKLYAAAILSFMGGVQWGLAMRTPHAGGGSWRRYGMSVLPALVAWAALLLAQRDGLALLGAGFVLLLIYDLWTIRKGEAPGWYERLRLGLTTVVICSITATLMI